MPVIRNTPGRRSWSRAVAAPWPTPDSRRHGRSWSRDHGCYIWGADVWEAKRHTEVYHYLFNAVVARRDRGTTRPATPRQEGST